jgi:hypothetical protein
MAQTLCPATYAHQRTQNGTESIVTIYCKQWSCDRCRLAVSKLWSHRIYEAFYVHSLLQKERGGGGSLYFTTLTMPRGWHKSDNVSKAHYDHIKKSWSLIVREARKRYSNWAYVAVIEAHRTGVPHLHILSTRPLPTPNQPNASEHELHNYAVQHGFGYQVKMLIVTGAQGASYVAKYLSKSGHKLPKGTRRVLATHGFIEGADKSDSAWIVRKKGQEWIEWAGNVESASQMTAIEALRTVDTLMSHNTDGIQRSGINALLDKP